MSNYPSPAEFKSWSSECFTEWFEMGARAMAGICTECEENFEPFAPFSKRFPGKHIASWTTELFYEILSTDLDTEVTGRMNLGLVGAIKSSLLKTDSDSWVVPNNLLILARNLSFDPGKKATYELVALSSELFAKLEARLAAEIAAQIVLLFDDRVKVRADDSLFERLNELASKMVRCYPENQQEIQLKKLVDRLMYKKQDSDGYQPPTIAPAKKDTLLFFKMTTKRHPNPTTIPLPTEGT